MNELINKNLIGYIFRQETAKLQIIYYEQVSKYDVQ
jgi:hypothetical protein